MNEQRLANRSKESRAAWRAGFAKAALLWLLAWGAAAGLLVLKAAPKGTAAAAPPAAALAPAVPCVVPAAGPAAPRYACIEDVRVGQRVVTPGADPAAGASSPPTAVDSATWKKLTLRMEDRWPDGTADVTEVQTLQPPQWVSESGATVGARVPLPLDLREMGEPDEPAEVVAVGPCPPVAPGPGRVVLTTVTHLNAFLFDLTLAGASGRRELIQVTGWHKLYSEQRGWEPACHLRKGEVLRGREGPLSVVSLERWPGTHRVYNMTVEGEHVYYVSDLDLLAHNQCPPPGGTPHSPDRQALNSLVREATNNGTKPLSVEDANTVLDWAQEQNIPGVRAGPGDVSSPSNWPGGGGQPHIHVPGTGVGGHIPVDPGVAPR